MDNGLYFLRVEPAGGGKAENGGVLVLRNGRILGGDAFFYYVGSYSGSNGNWTGEFATKQHTRSELVQATSAGAGYRITMRRIADA
jgi:hypothetical protein